MSARRKQSTKDLGAILNEAVPLIVAEEVQLPADSPIPPPESTAVEEPAEAAVEPVTWRKSTIPFRDLQYQEIGHILSEFHFRNDVQLTIAEVVRLGLDKMIEALKDDEQLELILVELYQQQRRESDGNENLKHSRSRGLGDYLASHGFLST